MTVNRLGMFLLSMNKPSEKVSFLDEVDITLSLDSRQPSGRQMTSIELSVLPIVLRASMRDINLIMSIVNRGIELSSQSSSQSHVDDQLVPTRPSGVSRAGPSRRSAGRKSAGSHGAEKPRMIMSKEKVGVVCCSFAMVTDGRASIAACRVRWLPAGLNRRYPRVTDVAFGG